MILENGRFCTRGGPLTHGGFRAEMKWNLSRTGASANFVASYFVLKKSSIVFEEDLNLRA